MHADSAQDEQILCSFFSGMIFNWVKRRRRRRLLRQPLPEQWRETLRRNVYHYARLSAEEQAKLGGDLRIFVAEKSWEGCGGLEMSEEIQVTIAAQACLLTLGFQDEYFEAVQSILVYPDAFVAPETTLSGGGLVLEGESSRDGEAWYRGPVILSWAEALAAGRGESGGDNVVLHEFAHQLDMQNGDSADGTPPLASRDLYVRWQEVMQSEFDRLVRDCRGGRPGLLDCYGSTDRSELFAVATECFFEQPRAMRRLHPQLYGILREYYCQDPAVRVGGAGSETTGKLQ